MRLREEKIWPRIMAVDLLMLCVSFSMATVGQMRDYIEAAYGLTASEGGLLISMQSIGGFAVTVIAIVFIDSFNARKLIVLAGLLTGVLIIGVGITQPLAALFVVFILLGFFAGIVKTLVNSVMYQTVTRNAERHLAVLHTLFSLAAVIAPIASYTLYQSFNLFGAFLAIGGASMVFAVYGFFTFRESFAKKLIQDDLNVKHRTRELIKVIKMPGMPAITFISFMISAWQLVGMYSLSTYFTRINNNGSQGAFALSIMFLGTMLARLVYSKFAVRFSPSRVLLTGCLMGFIAWTAMVIVDGFILKTVLLGLAAICCGANIPITYVVGCKIAPKSAGTASAIISFGYYLALFVFVPIISLLGEATSLGFALMVSGAPLILLIPATVFLHKKTAD